MAHIIKHSVEKNIQNFKQIKCQKSFAFESLLLGKLTPFQFIPVHSIAFIRHSRESERRTATKNSNNVIVNFIVMTHRILISKANVEIDKSERFVGGLRHRRRTETVRLDWQWADDENDAKPRSWGQPWQWKHLMAKKNLFSDWIGFVLGLWVAYLTDGFSVAVDFIRLTCSAHLMDCTPCQQIVYVFWPFFIVSTREHLVNSILWPRRATWCESTARDSIS